MQSVGSMRERNNCNPQLGQRRRAIGGNGNGSGRLGCGMVHPEVTGGSTTGLSVTDACTAGIDDVGTRRPVSERVNPRRSQAQFSPYRSQGP